MNLMITWKVPPASHEKALERFLETGAPVSKGMTRVGRWHTSGSIRGWHPVEDTEAAERPVRRRSSALSTRMKP
jgi:hypothetical protein